MLSIHVNVHFLFFQLIGAACESVMYQAHGVLTNLIT